MDLVWFRGLGVVVAGPQARYTARPVVAPMLAFGVRFHPGAAPALLRLAAVEFIDDRAPLSAVDARLAARIGHELARASDERQAFAALNRELMRLVERLQPDPVVREAVALLESRPSTVAERTRLCRRTATRAPIRGARRIRTEDVAADPPAPARARAAQIASPTRPAGGSRGTRRLRRPVAPLPREPAVPNRWLGRNPRL